MVSQQSIWLGIVIIVGIVMAIIIFAFIQAQQTPDSTIWQVLRGYIYDFLYFFLGPRIIEI